ncbi:hypothetical protein DFQ28_004777 [Apophysomyces sp. BC1034]|nr:hypothetical protein DFQ30_000338 [Apophysomyces sp. BC1015]KAG0188487.1 hypothetical protein DFQ28_004777 [Apophysomyces sp. BC1034]
MNENARSQGLFRDFFNNFASRLSKASLKFNTEKARLRSAITEDIVNDQEKENAKRQSDHCNDRPGPSKRRQLQAIDDNVNQKDVRNDDGNDDKDSHDSIWSQWQHFLSNPENIKRSMQLRYYADGIMKLNGFEFLLTEVSSGYNSADKSKVSFDHYKAVFGMLAMLKTLAQQFSQATFGTFSKVKVHFVHAHGTAFRYWSMSTPAKGVYVMVKEQRVVVPVEFHNKDLTLQPFVTFHKSLGMACMDSLEELKALKNEHKEFFRSPGITRPSLASLVRSMVIRLNEAKHASVVADDGPMSGPESPSHA